MRAKELMIGDWVFLKNGKVLQPCKVTVIGNATQNRNEIGISVCLDTSDEFPTCIFEIDEISPIPLTAEILEKNDFEKRWQDVYEYFNDDENLNMTFYPKSSNYTNGAYDYIDIEKGCLTINEMPIAFVHELQHALRLCGIEKQIEL